MRNIDLVGAQSPTAATTLARIAGAMALLLCAVSAHSQNATRGKQLYETRINPSFLSCSDVACHGANPLANMNRIRNGASAQAILAAADTVALMSPLRTLISAGDATDLSAYIANPAAMGPAGLAASAPLLSFGSTAVGATNPNSNPAATTVTNNTAVAVTISGIAKSGTHAAEFTASGTCTTVPVQLAPAASCTLGASFSPAAAGTRTATLAVQSDAPSNAAVTLTGMATATPAPTVALSRNTVIFPTQTVAITSPARDVTVRNTGTAPLTISEVTAAPMPEFSTSSTCLGTLIPGGSCSVVVVFTPSAAGTRAGSVTLVASAGSATIALEGNGVLSPTPIVTAADSALALGSVEVGSTPPSKSMQIANTGNAALQISAVEVRGQDARDFALTNANTCKVGTLAPLEECRLDVEFKPQGGGAKSATVTLVHNASGGSTGIALSGTATVPPAPAPASAASAPSQGGGGALSLPLAIGIAAAALMRRRRSSRER